MCSASQQQCILVAVHPDELCIPVSGKMYLFQSSTSHLHGKQTPAGQQNGNSKMLMVMMSDDEWSIMQGGKMPLTRIKPGSGVSAAHLWYPFHCIPAAPSRD